MSSNRQPTATSTPKRPIEEKPEILKEQQGNNDLKRNFHRATIQKSTSPIKSPKEFKENDLKRKQSGNRHRNQGSDVEKQALRRQQAVEAMKIQECRRLRFVEQAANLAADGSATESFDSLSEEKRLVAKEQKRKRIMAFLAEQDSRKKKEAEFAEAAKEAPKDEKITNILKVKADLKTPIVARKSGYTKEKSQRGFPIYTPKNRCSFKPMPVLPEAKEPKHKRVMVSFMPVLSDVEETKEYFKNKLEVQEQVACKVQRQRIIHYTKDELRSLNPYGFYFM